LLPDLLNAIGNVVNDRGGIVSDNPPPPPPPPLKIKYVGAAGLGHRLIRMSSVYHLARILQVPKIDIMWRGYCPKRYRSKPNIFDLLFANSTTIQVPSMATRDQKILFPFLSHKTPESLSRALFGDFDNTTRIREVKIINEVEGYIHSYDNDAMLDVNPPFYGKLMTDYEFYNVLLERYRYRKLVDQLFAPYKDHAIIGVHIRAGNGEVGDFEKYRQLGQGNLEGWLSNFTNLLKTHVLQDSTMLSKPKSAIFLATDTASVLEYFRQHFDDSVPIIATPQDYPTKGDGVSYNGYHENLTTCLDSWKFQMMDMVGLAEFSNVLIAGQYSSFTQSLPLARILNDNQRQRFFCDVDQSAQALKCYDSIKGISSWFAAKDATYVGKTNLVDRSTFAGPQIFLPTELEVSSLLQMIRRGGGPKKGPKK